MNTNNLILDTDSYKASHWLQYPPGTTAMFSYLESRGGRFEKTVFFGLQYLLKQYLSKGVTVEDVLEAEAFFKAHGEPFNKEGWMYIAKELGGKLPLKIRAVPEGTLVPTHNILMSAESTDPKVFWIVSWFETMLMRTWYPITVATQSYHIREDIYKYLVRTSDTPDQDILFKLHDFGSRGVSSRESAGIGGASHLINFLGSDTVEGVVFANHFYNDPMAGFSIPAAEHSSITSWGKGREVEAFRNMLKQFGKPGGLLAVVSDSYNIYDAASKLWGEQLRQEVIDSGATVVIRPDSGKPDEVVLDILKRLDEKFGHTMNSHGYKVLNNVRVIQGDGINQAEIKYILDAVTNWGYSATNVAFGMGGALLQQVNRDTQKFAYKCSEITVNGQTVPVFKEPITDPGKNSKAGHLDLIKDDEGNYMTVARTGFSAGAPSELQTVFENGVMKNETSFKEVRGRAWPVLVKTPSLI